MTRPKGKLMQDLEASIQHVEHIHRRREALRQAHEAAEEQLAHRIGVALRAGELTLDDVLELYRRIRMVSAIGFSARWSAAVGSSLASLRNIHKSAPNGPGGTWYGPRHPLPGAPVPRAGTPVVYVLYDDHFEPCYVGSSSNLRSRLSAHRRDKAFDWWTASACETRQEAYDREYTALQAHRPALNRVRNVAGARRKGAA